MTMFRGGDLDGRGFDHTQLAILAHVVPFHTETGPRMFLFMPPAEACDAILAGRATKENYGDTFHTYERSETAAGPVEMPQRRSTGLYLR